MRSSRYLHLAADALRLDLTNSAILEIAQTENIMSNLNVLESLESKEKMLTPPGELRRVSWGAIFAGAIAALATLLLLSLLGAAVGGSTINPAQGDQPGQGTAIGAAMWFVVSMLLSLFCGGWVAGRMAGIPNKRDGALHGFITWGVASLALVYMLSSAVGSMLGGAASILGHSASLVTQGAKASAPAAAQIMAQATGTTPEELKAEAGDLASDPNFQQFVAGTVKDGQVNSQDRQALANVLIQRRGMTPDQANTTIDRWQAQLQQTVQHAKQTAITAEDKAATGVSRGGFGGFFALLLGLLASIGGGWAGAPLLHTNKRHSIDSRIAA